MGGDESPMKGVYLFLKRMFSVAKSTFFLHLVG